jgi:putative ABC transport system permease protein
MSVIIYKIWRDLWEKKARTLQVVLIIAMGAFAIGMIITLRNALIPAMEQIWVDADVATINLNVNPKVEDETITALSGIEGVEDVEGRMATSIEWRLHPDDPWSAGRLTARNDYKEQKYTKVSILSGDWPHGKMFAMSQGTDTYGIEEGGQVYVRIDDREHVVTINGTLYDPAIQPPSFGGSAQFYATRDRFGDLTGERDFNLIMAGITFDYDETQAQAVADKMQRKLDKQKVNSGGASPPGGSRVTDPDKHFFQDSMDALFTVMQIMAVLALILGLFLVYNTITAIVSQQTDQIGVMKAVGAKWWQIATVYLVNVLAYGLLALIIAMPLGIYAGWQLNLFLLDGFNAEPGPFSISGEAVRAQIFIALLTPLVVSLIPVLAGARITVREAISTYGLSAESGLLERYLARMEKLSRTILLTISNTFRHKGRVVLTQISLVLSGLIFMMVMSVGDSTVHTFTDVVFSILNFDINLILKDPERIERIEALTLGHPDVKAVEMWSFDGATIRLASQPESDDDESVTMLGVPLPTTLYGPQMRAGRWLKANDTQTIVINEQVAEDAGLNLGDWVTVDHGFEGETTWQVVGILFDPVVNNSAHVSRDVMLRDLNDVGQANTIWIQTISRDPVTINNTADSLRNHFDELHVDLRPGSAFGQNDTATEITDNVIGQFNTIITLLVVMAVVIGAVGSVALSGVLSLNVIERTREIGVMRAIGASSGTISRLFIGEGLILGWLSWLIALPLSIPAGQLMTDAVGSALGTYLVYNYTPKGALYWFVIITVLAILASLLPARGATRVSVRESLAYQ